MRAVTPCYVKFNLNYFEPFCDVIDIPTTIVLMMCSLCCYKTQLNIMPTFQPTDYMLRTFESKISGVKDSEQGGEVQPWEIYAWCLRDAMAVSSGMGISDMPIKNKLEFENFMNKQSNEIVINQRTFKWQSKQVKL